MARLTERRESIEDILFEIRTMIFFRNMKKEYKNSQLGFMFSDLHLAVKGHLKRLIRIHEREHGEKLDIKVFERMMG